MDSLSNERGLRANLVADSASSRNIQPAIAGAVISLSPGASSLQLLSETVIRVQALPLVGSVTPFRWPSWILPTADRMVVRRG